jgi:hypothetical protein
MWCRGVSVIGPRRTITLDTILFTAETLVKNSLIRSRSQRTFESAAAALSIHSIRQDRDQRFHLTSRTCYSFNHHFLVVSINTDIHPSVQFGNISRTIFIVGYLCWIANEVGNNPFEWNKKANKINNSRSTKKKKMAEWNWELTDVLGEPLGPADKERILPIYAPAI